MALVAITCSHCGKVAEKEIGAVNRARRVGPHLFCSRQCTALHRRIERSDDELKRMKAEYDARYRVALAAELAAKKRAYHRRTYDPAKAREVRKHRSFDHTAYCRRYYADPSRKHEKVEYDKRFRATKHVGEYWECMVLLTELWKEIRKQEPCWYERAKAKGFLDKLNERKRNDRRENREARTA